MKDDENIACKKYTYINEQTGDETSVLIGNEVNTLGFPIIVISTNDSALYMSKQDVNKLISLLIRSTYS